MANTYTTSALALAPSAPVPLGQATGSLTRSLVSGLLPRERALTTLLGGAWPADATAVTPTLSAANASSGITSKQTINADATHALPAAVKVRNGLAFPTTLYPYYYQAAANPGYVTSPFGVPPVSFEFTTDAPKLEVLTWGTSSHFRFRVNGTIRTPASVLSGSNNVGAIPGDGQPYLITLDFGGVRAVRRVRLETSNNFYFGGLNLGPTDSLWAPSKPVGPTAVWLGDSYVESSTGPASPLDGFPVIASDALGWHWVNSGSGGTGYLNPGNNGRVAFQGRVQNDVVGLAPEIVVVSGGINDSTDSNAAYTTSALATAADLLYSTLKAGLPTALIIVVGPWLPNSAKDAAHIAVNTTLAARAAAAVLPFIDVSAYFTGTGKAGATTGSGNQDVCIYSDGTHPTEAGHAYIGSRLPADIRSAVSVW